MADASYKDDNQSRIDQVQQLRDQQILDAGQAPPIYDQSQPNSSSDPNQSVAPPYNPQTDPNSPSYIAPQNVPGSPGWHTGRNVNVNNIEPDRLTVPDPNARGGFRSIPNPNAGKTIGLPIQGNSPNKPATQLTAPPAQTSNQTTNQPNPNDVALNAYLQPHPAPAPHATKLDRRLS